MSASMKTIESVAAQNINLFTPVVDRWSPLAYSLADWIHTEVSSHSGHKSTFRKSLNFCFILQGLSLFEEIGSSCIFCTKPLWGLRPSPTLLGDPGGPLWPHYNVRAW